MLGYWPCNSDGNELIVYDPDDPEREIERLVFPRQPRHDRICLADFYRPVDSGERDVVALQAVTVGDEVTELMARLETDGEFSEQLFVHGLGVQTAEGMAEYLHAEVRKASGSTSTRAGATPGATPPARTSPSTPRSSRCWTRPRSACACRAASPSSPSSRRWRSSPTTRRPPTSA